MYGPVAGSGFVPMSLFGADFGTASENGRATLSRNSGSGAVRWTVRVIAWSSATAPADRSHFLGVHLLDPTMLPSVHVPGEPTRKSRSQACTKSLGTTGSPLENLIPGRILNTYVLPPSVAWGIADARSGTSVAPSGPPTRLNPV